MKTNHEWTRIDRKTEGDDDAWTAGGALRFEDFEGFGGTLNGKVSGRLRLVEAFSLRSSLSTGFRLPHQDSQTHSTCLPNLILRSWTWSITEPSRQPLRSPG